MTKASPSRRAAALAALALPLLLAGCADGDERASPAPETTTTTAVEPAPPQPSPEPAPPDEPAPTTTGSDPYPMPSPTTTTEPRVETSPPAAPRTAPATEDGDLRFDRIVVLREDGRFAGRANVRNDGAEFLNDVRLRWRIVDATGAVLDAGAVTWPSLAPGETATVHFAGTRAYRESWRRVELERVG
jgi:hypothetical protein